MTSTEKTKKKPTADAIYKELSDRITNLENALSRIAHQTGTANILSQFKIDKYEPNKKDMQKWAG